MGALEGKKAAEIDNARIGKFKFLFRQVCAVTKDSFLSVFFENFHLFQIQKSKKWKIEIFEFEEEGILLWHTKQTYNIFLKRILFY